MTTIATAGRQQEQGVVSLLTVIFFMIFLSLIVVGFTTIVIADQRQATDNDLSASALAAARGGVEDGKRILLYCQQNPAAAECSEAVLNSQNNCDLFKNNTDAQHLATALKITINSEGEGLTGTTGAEAYEQYFTCLTLQTKTPSFSTTLNEGAGYIQRLKTVSPFTKLKIKWSGEGSYIQRSGSLTGGWPTVSDWGSGAGLRYMPVIRLQTIPYTDLSNLDTVEANSRTVYVVPCNGSTCPSFSQLAIDGRSDTGQTRSVDAPPIVYAQCQLLGSRYNCSITLDGYDSAAWQYYIRASVLYASTTTLEVSALDSAGTVVNFDNIQPWIDVTGRTNDVFRRVRAEVSYASSVILPENALDTAAPLCKDMTVTNAAASSTYNCP